MSVAVARPCPKLGKVVGIVLFAEGNRMPGAEILPAKPVRRTIGFFRPTTFSQTTVGKSSGFFISLGAKPLYQTKSDAKGKYRLRLKAGTYTVCVKEAGQWYANGSDHQGRINTVTITADQTTQFDVLIDYLAAY
jgi:uncharacterized protein YegP (UPF0339 family)